MLSRGDDGVTSAGERIPDTPEGSEGALEASSGRQVDTDKGPDEALQASGRIAWRKRKVAEILGELQEEDNLLVSELSRLGRSMLECMEILSIAAQKGINVYALNGYRPKSGYWADYCAGVR